MSKSEGQFNFDLIIGQKQREIEQFERIIRNAKDELYKLQVEKSQLKDAEWEYRKQQYYLQQKPQPQECKDCQKRQGTFRCNNCEKAFCEDCVLEYEDNDYDFPLIKYYCRAHC